MIVAGTGHRPDKLGGYHRAAADPWIAEAEVMLILLSPEKVISGLALGWDTYLALAAIRLGIPLVGAIPFNGQESRWPPESQSVFWWINERAAELVVVCGGGYAPYKMQKRNEWMVDHCDFLLSCWNGTPGGTANCLAYARDKWGDLFDTRHYNCHPLGR